MAELVNSLRQKGQRVPIRGGIIQFPNGRISSMIVDGERRGNGLKEIGEKYVLVQNYITVQALNNGDLLSSAELRRSRTGRTTSECMRCLRVI